MAKPIKAAVMRFGFTFIATGEETHLGPVLQSERDET